MLLEEERITVLVYRLGLIVRALKEDHVNGDGGSCVQNAMK